MTSAVNDLAMHEAYTFAVQWSTGGRLIQQGLGTAGETGQCWLPCLLSACDGPVMTRQRVAWPDEPVEAAGIQRQCVHAAHTDESGFEL